MTHPDGGFYSAEDADSEGHEGKFYCWTKDELSKLLTAGGIQRGREIFWHHRKWEISLTTAIRSRCPGKMS
jgi:uncharacterized protein YyaL (SSP411 family)